MKQSLNGIWRLHSGRYDLDAVVPGSFCDTLMNEGLIGDPYYRLNEYATLPVFDEDIVYEREFDLNADMCGSDRILLRFYGIDTLAEVLLNGETILRADNMHRTYTCDVTDIIKPAGNTLTVRISS
ncbi:MAG: glycoside hydrolase family 2 protein, partial [Ruminococcus sp.]|nr:glycoside hydrolase family 2 protein [Ruminococcus sp.]